MKPLDPFTSKRILKFVEDFRNRTGALPTIQDFEKSGMSRELVKQAVAQKLIESFYVTLTNGTIVKGFKLREQP